MAEVAGAVHLVKLLSFGSMGTISVLAGCAATHWEHLPQNFSSAVVSSLGVLLICWERKKKRRKNRKKKKQNKKEGVSIKLVNLPQSGK